MLSQISKALETGFTEDQVLDFVVKKFPKFASKIMGAKSAGFNGRQILNTLLGQKKERENNDQPRTEYEGTINKDKAEQNSRQNQAVAAGTLAATSLAAPIAASALQRAIPSSLQSLLPAMTASTTGQNQLANPIDNTSQQPPLDLGNANPTQPINIEQPKENSNKLDRLWTGFEKGRDKGFDFDSDGFLKIAKRMKSTGEIKSREDFEKFYNLFEQKKNEGKDLPAALKEASAEYDGQKLAPSIKEDSEIEKAIEKPQPIQKSNIVSSPQGLGTVKEIRNGQALVEVDGKLHKVQEEDLEPSLYSEDEVADVYEKLMDMIPETHRSGFIQWAGYDEDKNELGFIPRSGKYEVLTDITPEEAQMIKEGKGTARTSGKNMEGLWVVGEDTRGGIISQIIHDRRKKNESNAKNQLKFDLDTGKPEKQDRGMKPIFDEISYPRDIAHARERKKKLEDRERKKREKDEAKKRKK